MLDHPIPEGLNWFEARDLVGDGEIELVCTVIMNADSATKSPTECGEVVCTIEYEDSLAVLAATALDHYREHHG